MTELIIPNLPDDHPLSMYVSNLRAGTSLSWFSDSASVDELRDYVWNLMNLHIGEIRLSAEGFAETHDESVLFIGAESPIGSIFTCFPLDQIGLGRVNAAVSLQWDTAMEEGKRGQFRGFPVQHHLANIVDGVVVSESWHFAKGGEAIPLINTATVVRLDGGEMMATEERAGLTRSDIEMVLRHDPDVQSWERIDDSDGFWRIHVSFDDHPPVELFVNNALNEINLIVFVAIDWEHPGEALDAVGPYQVVGLVKLGDMLLIRSGFFIDHSTIHAFTNCYRSVAMAYWAYQNAIAG